MGRARVFVMVASLVLAGCVHNNIICQVIPVPVKEKGDLGKKKWVVVAGCFGLI